MGPHRRQPTRLPRPWDSPGKNTGVGCYFLLQCVKGSRSVMSDPQRPHELQPTRLLCPWDFPGKSTGVGVLLPSPIYLLEWLNLQRLALPGVGEDVELLKISHIVDRNANGTAILEDSMEVLVKLWYNTTIPLLAIYPKERPTSTCSHTKILSCWLCWKGLPSRGQPAMCLQDIFSHHKGDI